MLKTPTPLKGNSSAFFPVIRFCYWDLQSTSGITREGRNRGENPCWVLIWLSCGYYVFYH
jgi:hypothetical protein